MEPLIELKNVSYSYHTPRGETSALTNITFSIRKGEFIAIVGPSGCGKSTLLSLIAGLLFPESGCIDNNSQEARGLPIKTGYMLQRDHLFEWRTVYQNICLGLEIQNLMTPKAEAFVQSMMKDYGLYAFRNSRPSQLSGGMRQRAALIRTLVLQPELLLLDEPFSALDYQTRLSVCEDVFHILKEQKKTAVLVTHDLSEAISMADRIIILSKRPAVIQKIMEISFKENDMTPVERRKAPEFQVYFEQIWEEMQKNGR